MLAVVTPLRSPVARTSKRSATFRNLATLVFIVVAIAKVPGNGTAESYDGYLESLYRDTVPIMQPQELATFLENQDAPLVLDIRTPAERSVSSIPGSRFIRFESFDLDDVEGVARDRTVVLYCAVGFRSERVGEQLLAAGFTDVFNLYGGIIEWHNRGYRLQPGPAATPDDAGAAPPVHGYRPRWGRWVERGRVIYEPNPEE